MNITNVKELDSYKMELAAGFYIEFFSNQYAKMTILETGADEAHEYKNLLVHIYESDYEIYFDLITENEETIHISAEQLKETIINAELFIITFHGLAGTIVENK